MFRNAQGLQLILPGIISFCSLYFSRSTWSSFQTVPYLHKNWYFSNLNKKGLQELEPIWHLAPAPIKVSYWACTLVHYLGTLMLCYTLTARRLLWHLIFNAGSQKSPTDHPSRPCMATCGCREKAGPLCTSLPTSASPWRGQREDVPVPQSHSYQRQVEPNNKTSFTKMKSDTEYIGIFYFDFTCGVKNPKNVLFTHPQYKFTRYLYMLKYSIV